MLFGRSDINYTKYSKLFLSQKLIRDTYFCKYGSVVITSLTCPSYIAHTSNLFPATSCGTSLSLQFAAWCCMYYHLHRQQVFMLQKVHVTSTKKLLREREVSGKMLLVSQGVLVKI